MEYNVQNLEYAVSVFYDCEHQERIQAHQWLTRAQQCPEAWRFVWELLQINKRTEVQFFAATTLHTKILRCWSEVPVDRHDELRDKILQSVLGFSKGPKIVLNRLCISLAAYIMQQTTSDLATILRPLSSQENMSLLLEVLTVIPEEFTSMTMGSQKRTRNRSLLQQACPAVLDDMLRHIQSVYSKEQPTEEIVLSWNAAAACAASWLGLISGDTGSATLTECLPLCHALLQIVHVLYIYNEAISDTALEACESALGAVRAAGTAPDSPKYPAAALELLSALAALSTPVLARDNVPNSINEELVGSILTCGVALGECHTQVIVNAVEQVHPHEGAWQFLQLLLAGQASPGYYPLHETRSQFIFGFWYTLQDELICYFDNMNQVNDKWRGMFTRLLNILIEKSEAPAEENLSRDDAELLRCYRQDIADAVMYCFGVIGELCWNIVNAAWSTSGTDGKREAALHVFLALADAAPPQQAPAALRNMFANAIQATASSDNARLLNTSLECLGAFASWLASFEKDDREISMALTRDALQAAGSALEKSPQAAALALKKLSTECSDLAAPLAREITSAAQNSSITSDAWVRRQLLGAAGAALAASELGVAGPLLHELATLLTKDLMEDVSDSKSRRGAAEQAAALITALSPRPSLAVTLFQVLLPALPPFSADPLLVPSLFQVLRQAVSVLVDDCIPFLDEISQLAEQALCTHPCSNGHDLVTLIILMFDTQWAGCPRLLEASVKAGARACAADAANNCDTTQALFSSLHTITKKKPQYIDSLQDVLPQLVDLGFECMRLWEANAARAACGWLAVLADRRPAALLHRAPEITAVALRCIGGAIPRHQVEPLAEVLLALNRARWPPGTDLSLWLRQALQQDGFPTAYATQEYKHKFITAVLKEKSNKRRLLESVQEFSLVCRGVITTEYGKQSLSSKLAMP